MDSCAGKGQVSSGQGRTLGGKDLSPPHSRAGGCLVEKGKGTGCCFFSYRWELTISAYSFELYPENWDRFIPRA